MKQLAKPSRTLPSTSKGLSEASPAGRPAAASLWPVRGLPPLSAAGRPVAASLWPVRSLPPLFLRASEGDVRHFGPPSNPPRQPAGLLRPLCGQAFWTAFKPSGEVKQLAKPSQTLPSTSKGLSEASPAGRPAAASLWPVRGLPPLSAAGRFVAASLWPVRSLPPLFLWASEGCLLSSYGLPKATLGILDRLQTLLGSRQACCGLSVACPKPASSLLMGFRRRR